MTLNKTVLVTGGAGYIGSHVCKALAQQGYLPVAYDNLSHGHDWAVNWGPLELGDVLDHQRLSQVMRQYMPAAVMHFAAFASVGESVEEPSKYYHNNVIGSLSLLDAMREHGISNLVFSSTCATYGAPMHMPITESHPQKPINPYGHNKLQVEQRLQELADFDQLNSISLRYFNAAGADPEADIGEDHHPETHLIPLVLDVALGRRESISIFGNDYDTPDGTCIRDYIHVLDIAQAHIRALNALEQGAQTTVYNIGNGQGYSVQEVIDAVQRVTGCEVATTVAPRREGDPPRLVGDASKLRAELSWEPEFAKLDSIIQTAWAWHKSHFSAPNIGV
ncbi:MAG: UDP-arabinose 4-epimerase [Halieaceae bacterium]|jgi:UDP-arabinose 4-epimerase